MPRGLFDPRRSPVPRAHERAARARSVLTVSQVTALVRGAIEEELGSVWVEGEVSNLARPVSGHYYFTLKDDRAQLQAVLFRGTAAKIGFTIKDGEALLVFGKIGVYEPRGQYQIVVERAEVTGLGALQRAFEELKARLQNEGLFDPRHKKPIPFLPGAIGIVTSRTGAAIRDIVQVVWRRFPRARMVLAPVRVQGEGAAEEIARAIDEMNAWGEADVLVVGRGGGSLEDLWAFNEEVVARAIHRSRIPVVSAVGHEADVSISDMVADVRALTPSEAGERVVPRLGDLVEELEGAVSRMARAARARFEGERERLALIERSYGLHAPGEMIARERQRLDDLAGRVAAAAGHAASSAREWLAELAGMLEELSPVGVLSRGYSVTYRSGRPGEVLRDAATLAAGDRIVTRFARGEAESVVDEVRAGPGRDEGTDRRP